MAGDLKLKYGTSNQALTISLGSLTNNSARQSTYVDNATNVFVDALVSVILKTGASGTAATGYANVYAYATVDGGSNYTEGATGTDGSITLVSPTNLIRLGSINLVADATTYKSGPFSVAAAFGGQLPARWGIVIENKSGGTLSATGGDHSVVYQGVYAQYT